MFGATRRTDLDPTGAMGWCDGVDFNPARGQQTFPWLCPGCHSQFEPLGQMRARPPLPRWDARGEAPMITTLSDTPVLTTERLVIRAPQAGDEAQLIPFAMSDRAKYVGGGSDCDLGKAWRIFAIIAGHWVIRGYGTFVYCERETGTPIGSAGPWFPGNWPEPELGWTIWHPEHEGRGFAHEAMVAIRAFAYQTLGWTTAVSYIDEDNTRSQALAERLGCTRDPQAASPHPDEPVWVYRHPSPAEVLA